MKQWRTCKKTQATTSCRLETEDVRKDIISEDTEKERKQNEEPLSQTHSRFGCTQRKVKKIQNYMRGPVWAGQKYVIHFVYNSTNCT